MEPQCIQFSTLLLTLNNVINGGMIFSENFKITSNNKNKITWSTDMVAT